MTYAAGNTEEQSTAVIVDSLPPVAYLIMEVLGARHRLGEQWWTFPTKPGIRAAANYLETFQLVNVFHGITPGTFRVELTSVGVNAVLSPTYVAPVSR